MKALFPALCVLSLAVITAAPHTRAQNIPLPIAVQPERPDADVKIPDFEVASVRENKGDAGIFRWMNTPDGISFTNISLKNIIASAYNIRQYLISGGPSWVDHASFDINAKVAAADVDAFKKLSPAQRRVMLQKLLADRFKLTAHIESRTLPVYDLVLAPGGPKFKPAAPDPAPSADADPSDHPKPRGMLRIGRGMLNLQDMPIGALIDQISNALGRTVIDKTGLTGKYDLELKWTPDDHPGSESGLTDQDAAPHLFTALQEQLGLKLESSKGSVPTLVIDHVEMPTAN